MEQKKKVQKEVVRLFTQIQKGCSKDICYNQNCKCNPYAKDELLKYKENSRCLQYAVSLRQGTKDVSNILCSVSVSINKNNIDKMTDAELLDVFEDVY